MQFKKLLLILAILLLIALGWEALTRYLSGQNLIPTGKILEQIEPKPTTTSLTPEETLIINIVEDVGPSVITVAIDETNTQAEMDPFSFLFEDLTQEEDDSSETNIGSGFIVSSDGLVVTNKHVVAERRFNYIIIDDEGERYAIENIYRDPLNDIAIMEVESPPPGGLQASTLGDSSNLRVGQHAIAIGTALGEFRNTVTTGVISGLGRGITAGSPFEGLVERLDNVIQTDAAISPGNSGGPLLNTSGEVIGVNTAISGAGENIGFAIPINTIKETLENFENTGRFERPFLGVAYIEISESQAENQGIAAGALVQEVVEGSAADDAGLQEGDIITEIDGEAIAETEGNLAGIISTKAIGDEITLQVQRGNETVETTTTLQEAPDEDN